MFFQIVCESDNPYIHLLKQRRFYVEKADTAYTFFRKVWNRDDDFLSKAYISLEGWITEKGNPKLFKQYLKLELRNKCPCESVFCLSEDMRDVIVSMSENLRYVEFACSEDFGDLPEVGIGRGVLSDTPFFCVGFGQKYILNK